MTDMSTFPMYNLDKIPSLYHRSSTLTADAYLERKYLL